MRRRPYYNVFSVEYYTNCVGLDGSIIYTIPCNYFVCLNCKTKLYIDPPADCFTPCADGVRVSYTVKETQPCHALQLQLEGLQFACKVVMLLITSFINIAVMCTWVSISVSLFCHKLQLQRCFLKKKTTAEL